MLFSSISINTALILGLSSVALTNPVPTHDRDNLLNVDLRVGSGEPLICADIDLLKRDEAQLEDREEYDLETRALTSDQNESLRLHNAARAKKNLKALVWDSKLAADALIYARAMAKSGKFQHSTSASRPGQGENLAYAWSSRGISNPITLGTNGWLAEEKDYNNEIIPQGDFASYGHYTQIMWKSTTKVGIAAASNGANPAVWYTVARYSPAGNVVGQRPY